MQRLGLENQLTKKADFLCDEIIGKDSSLLSYPIKIAMYEKFMELMLESQIPIPNDVGKYKLLKFPDGSIDYLGLRVKQFIEIANAEIDINTFNGLEILCGCVYRKDWNKPITDYEIIETAMYFLKQPFTYSLWAFYVYKELMETMKRTYVNLYNDESKPEKEETGRQMDNMLNALSGDDVTKWELVYQQEIKTVFRYLENKKIEQLKSMREKEMRG